MNTKKLLLLFIPVFSLLSFVQHETGNQNDDFVFPSAFMVDKVDKSVPEIYTKNGKLKKYTGNLDKTVHFKKANPSEIAEIKFLSETRAELYSNITSKEHLDLLITPSAVKMVISPLPAGITQINTKLKEGTINENRKDKIRDFSTYNGQRNNNQFSLNLYVVKYKKANLLTTVETSATMLDSELINTLGPQDTLVVMNYKTYFTQKE